MMQVINASEKFFSRTAGDPEVRIKEMAEHKADMQGFVNYLAICLAMMLNQMIV